ncbi:UDP-3-O-(3-hydroxymyristoyl)glucosamine N-acyltransferase [Desulfoluna spongiiphila]|uniref:UDP-3-O-(3-hydroxymyristoyl)glucosamine N-acyltransferase n=1 Tax=Desulfoluna spongiiphila TaxID=419481 RepID=UPI001258F866|nr:UDP-3-O-(3-hydroxymyristoyl)glucosamine N-acyltransferase [Desulfoluna spongiiphila]VVS91209.1 udp-3-o-[3-hydroxymyristoyl] glucosamine n-acyltransferase lpxd [Desulfoluna spongiiphila]
MKRTVQDIADMLGGTVIGDGTRTVTAPAPFEDAKEDQVVFAGDASYLKRLSETGAGTVLVPEAPGDTDKSLIVVANPRVAFIRLMELFAPGREVAHKVSPQAFIGEQVTFGGPVEIGPGAVIGDNVSLGTGCRIFPGVVVEEDARLGDGVTLKSNVTIGHGCILGNRVVIHSGSVIGSDGYGFAPEGTSYRKIPHTGIVQIDDDVEIGALNAIDRATAGRTWIKRGVKTDNLVHVAHNVEVGEDTLLVAQVGIAGSTTVGNHVILAGKAGISGHIHIGDNTIVGPDAGVVKSVGDGEVVSGTPAMPHKLWLRLMGLMPKLPDLKRTVDRLEKRVARLESED